jgi:pyruvate formate lyase activating enzyme
VDTTGFASTQVLLEVAKRTELFLYDLKMMDSAKHQKYTGVPNEKILANLKILAERGATIKIRIPLIQGINDEEENIRQTAAFLASLPGEKRKVHLLPYHNIATKKYEKLGQQYDAGELVAPDVDRQQEVIEIFGQYGIEAVIGG